MKISVGRVGEFVANPDPAASVVLVYGPNAGLVREHCDNIVRKILDNPSDPFRLAELDAATVGKDPTRLTDELLALAFGGGQRVVIVRDASDGITKSLEGALEAGSELEMNAVALIEAGALSARSSLRKLCEKRKDCAALPCYADDERAQGILARNILKESRIDIAPDALRTLTDFLGDDRLANRREVEKLALFVGPKKTVQVSDVIEAVGDIGAATMDETVFAAAGGDTVRLDRAIERFFAEGGEPVGLIRSTQRHFQRMHRVAGLMDSGVRYDEAVKRLRPPVFWKQTGAFEQQVRSWSRGQLEQAIARLGEAELMLKTTGTPAQAACGRTLYAVALMKRG
ncbi:MAG: DNA polymerase III subunit delta [Alphaproteobacteria bacterium]|nr:DNA polymerase III subunit delta [Alphaproteobacteria bacterium]HCP00742.1 DNA polymerase III subunit delta [Rhodospirillaceae bacterium]